MPEPPYLRKVFGDLWEGLFSLIVWTLVLLVLSIPALVVLALSVPLAVIVAALTLGPGLAGMMVMSGKLARGGFARLGDAARGTLHLYGRSVALALPVALMLALIMFTSNVVAAFPERREMLAVWMLQIGIGLVAVFLHLYLFPVLALYDTSLKRTLLVAAVLMGKFIWQTWALLVVGVALLAATTLHPMVWLAVPVVWCVVVMNATWRMSRKMMGGPAKQN